MTKPFKHDVFLSYSPKDKQVIFTGEDFTVRNVVRMRNRVLEKL